MNFELGGSGFSFQVQNIELGSSGFSFQVQNIELGSSGFSFQVEFGGSGFSFQFVKSYHNLTIFCIKVSILNFSKECHYLENKVGVVDFTKARGMVKFQSPRALAGPWALKHYHSLGICKIYYSHFIFEVITFLRKNQNHSGKLSNYGSFSKIGRKNHYLEILK